MIRSTRYTLVLLISMRCAIACAGGVTPFADLLYFHASEETSSVWSSVVSQSQSGASIFAAEEVQFDWNAGLRTGIAFAPDEWLWDVKLYWTNFGASQSDSIPPGQQLVIPEFFSGFLSGNAFSFTSAALDWSLDFNTIDLEAGHEFALSDAVFIRPSLGLKAAIIKQSIHAEWADPPNALAATEDVAHDFWGIGPSFGVDGRWEIPRCSKLTLVGSFSGAFLYGVWNVNDTYQRTDPQSTLFTYRTVSTDMNDAALGTLMLRYFLGLEWTHEGDVPITVYVGYELQWWANQQRLPTFQQLPMHGDLTLQGCSCGISICF